MLTFRNEVSEEITIIDPAEHRTAWLQKLAEEFLKLEPLFPLSKFVPDEGAPRWVENVENEIAATMYPLARLKEDLQLTPKRLGGMIGHSSAYGVWMLENLEEQLSKPEINVDTTKLTAEQIEFGEKFVFGIVEHWYPALRRFAKRALCSAVDQSYEDMTEFLLAYSQAFSRKPKSQGLTGIGSSATETYFFLLTYWRVVNALSSVHELHQCLVRVFGPHRVGDLKRVEKICQRIDLHYRKPERPKKVKIIPTPA